LCSFIIGESISLMRCILFLQKSAGINRRNKSRGFMYLSPVRFSMAAFFVLGLAVAAGQTPDNSQNGLLKGSYRFRHVAVQNVDQLYNPTEITASSGTITFDGAGNYTIVGAEIDNLLTNGLPVALNISATYAIGSSGAGYIANPIDPTDPAAWIYGAVAQGVFTGSSTESEQGAMIFNDIFIAIPAGATPATNAGFSSGYQTGMLDFTAAGSSAIKNALFELTPNGKGGFGVITLNGQAADQPGVVLAQSVTGATYSFGADGSAALTIPLPSGVATANALFTGSRTMFESADGNFILGWNPTGYDIFFGIRALAVPGTNLLSRGLYFTTALEDSPSYSGTDSYYGSTNNSGDAAGDGIVHERLNLPGGVAFDYGLDDQTVVNSNGSTGTAANGYTDLFGYEYLFGDGGSAFVAIGTNGNFSLLVGMHAPAFSGPGVYLNPIGVTNAANAQPVTARIAPGELLTLVGAGLSSTTVQTQGGQAFPMKLGGVTVSINNLPCPIYYVTPGQLAVSVPYGVAANQTGLADIQVANNGILSNMVQMHLTDAAPGSFSQSANGIGYATATHAATGQMITPANPAQPGEYISLYLTGLGTVTPTVTDGDVGPSGPLSWSDLDNAGSLTVNFNDYTNGIPGNTGTIAFAGLAPTLAGLYQINVQVPTSGLVAGDNIYVEFITDAAAVNQIQIPYGLGSTLSAKGTAGTLPNAARITASRLRARSRNASTRTK
jgi:uncharacterized protein (TIGR03437 family)